MSQEAVEQFLGRAITDGRFRERAMKELLQTCRGEGFILSEAEATHLSKLDFTRFDCVAAGLDDSIKRN